MKAAILGALEEEIELLKSSLDKPSSFSGGGMKVFTGLCHGIEVGCARSGMGLVAAAGATQFLIDAFLPDLLIFSGIAGALTEECGIGEVVIGKSAVFLDADMDLISQDRPYQTRFHSDPHLVQVASRALKSLLIPHVTGSLVSSNRFIGSADMKKSAKNQSGADAAEMEGAAFLQICAKNRLPALVLRTISDGACIAYSSFRHFDTSSYSEQSNKVVLKVLELLSSEKVEGKL